MQIARNLSGTRKSEEGQRPDFILLALLAILLMIGLESVYSSSFAFSLAQYNDATYIVSRQAMWAVLGTVLLLVCMRIDYLKWRDWSKWVMLATLISLIAVLLPVIGYSQNGAARWIQLPSPLPPLQPSEFAKLAVIIYVSAWLASKQDKLKDFSTGVIPFVVLVGFISGLLMLEPDMGTAIVLTLTAFTLFFIAGASMKYIVILVSATLVVAFPLILGVGYRAGRMQAFLDPWSDPTGQGFHIIQSLIALGSGGLTGLGIGASRQKFLYVPGSHTDAIFAIIGEELGFIGAVVVVLLYIALAYRGFKIALSAEDRFGSFLAAGITCWFSYQALINIGGITNSIPFTGIPLPFISYGGSSLAVSMAAVGILLSISRNSPISVGKRKLSSYLSAGD